MNSMGKMYMPLFYSPLFSPCFVLIISLITFISWYIMPSETVAILVEEKQLIEYLTLFAYFITLLYIWLSPLKNVQWSTQVAIWIVLLVMMAREADLHKYIYQISILKSRFWIEPYPIINKFYAFLLLIPIFIACMYLIIKYYSLIVFDILKYKNYAITIVTFIALIFITKIIDRSLGVLKELFSWQEPLPLWLVTLITSQEESLELLLPILALVAILQHCHQTKTLKL